MTPALRAVDVDAAVAAVAALGAGSVALKLDADGLAHKSDIGAVRLGLAAESAVRAAAEDLLTLARAQQLAVRGLLVEPMAEPGVELIVGLRRDPLFGPAILVGLGGILAELLDDVAVGLAPVSASEAAAMLDGLRGADLLDGARGGPVVDRAAIIELIVGLGRFATTRPDIAEVDLNPVVAGPSGALAVDALVVVDAS
jgi:hypothetical protein